MFENLTDKLARAFKNLRGHGRLDEENIKSALREVRISLLEADVALKVVDKFSQDVKEKALGQEVMTKLKPDEAFIKVVRDELIELMGSAKSELDFKTEPPAVFLLAGLQGSGKTTTAAKLARFIRDNEKKKIMLASTDTWRPAAIQQLQILAKELGVEFFAPAPGSKPVDIAKQALSAAKRQFMEVLIVDTAGRLHIDDTMMDEIKSIHQAVQPIETLFVVDSMTGQDAANTALAFHNALPLTGVILTKTDGDARGGAALSVRYITGQPIKFLGTGEKIDALEMFYPERISSRILGMGDILSLLEDVERKTDKASAEKLTKKLKRGHGFDLEDFREQLMQMNKMGGLAALASKLPGVGQMPPQGKMMDDKVIGRTIAIINSMTIKERQRPQIIIGSRKKRIANGAGVNIPEVNKVLKQYTQMQKMAKKFANPRAMQQVLKGMGPMGGAMQGLMPDKFN